MNIQKITLHLCTFIALILSTNIVYSQTQWQPGDLIFRQGNAAVSDVVLLADSQSLFSHVGMLIGGPQQWQVIHATPEEIPGRGDKVVIDSLEFFISPERSEHYEVYHVNAPPEAREKAVKAALQQLGEAFTIKNGEGLYCTTLIWHSWLAGQVDLDVQFTEVKLPLVNGYYLMPSGLLQSRLLTKATNNYQAEKQPSPH